MEKRTLNALYLLFSLILFIVLSYVYLSYMPFLIIFPATLSLSLWSLKEGLFTLLLTLLFVVGRMVSEGAVQFPPIILGLSVALGVLLFMESSIREMIIKRKRIEDDLRDIKQGKETIEQKLYESETLLSSLISNVPGTIYRCTYDKDWTMQFISDPIEILSGYSAHDYIQRNIRFFDLIHEEDYPYVQEEVIQQIEKGELYDLEYRIIRKDGSIRWIKERGEGVRREDGSVVWLDGVLVDITEERLVQEEISKEKRRLDVTLRSIGEGVIATDAEGRVLLFNQKAEEMTGWTEKEALHRPVFKVYRVVDKDKELPCEDPVKQVLRTREEIHVSSNKGLLTKWGYEISIADSASPIMYDGVLHGVVLVFRDITREKEAEKERAKLLEETKRGLNESLSLQMVTSALLQMINLEEILELVCSEAEALTGSSDSCVFLIEEEDWLAPVFSSGKISIICQRIPIKNSLTGLAVKTGEPVVSNDYKTDERKFIGDVELDPENLLAVPLALKDENIGALAILNKPGGFNEDDVRIISLFANQASVAIENARLYKKVQELATMKERQRLARDLHDAVSQTLFSASLIAEVLPVLWEKNKEEGLLRLVELKELTRGALAEMRGLLLELRPQGLVETGLEELINYLADAVKGRARIPVSVEIKGDGSLPPDVHIGFYRIIQESLNNIVKHSGATEVFIKLQLDQKVAFFAVRDNGRGFEPEKVKQDCFGLKIMMERANEIGAMLTIESEINQGTTIEVLWTLEREEALHGRED